VASLFNSSLSTRCLHTDSPPAERKKVFALATRLTDPRMPELMIRERAVDTLLLCDWAALEKLLPRLKKDAQLADTLKRVADEIKHRKDEAKKKK
jgi:hypothetical protein